MDYTYLTEVTRAGPETEEPLEDAGSPVLKLPDDAWKLEASKA